MILDSPYLGKPDMYASVLTFQPQAHFDKVPWDQEIGSSELGTRLAALQHTAVGFDPAVHAGQDAVDRRSGSGPTGLLLTYRHRVRLG